MPVIAPCRSGLDQTMPSDHITISRSSETLSWVSSASPGNGNPDGSNIRVSQPKARKIRAPSVAARREKLTSRNEPYSSNMRGGCPSSLRPRSLSQSSGSRALGVRFGRSDRSIFKLTYLILGIILYSTAILYCYSFNQPTLGVIHRNYNPFNR